MIYNGMDGSEVRNSNNQFNISILFSFLLLEFVHLKCARRYAHTNKNRKANQQHNATTRFDLCNCANDYLKALNLISAVAVSLPVK